MVLRLLGLKQEKTYGKLDGEYLANGNPNPDFDINDIDPDFHRRLGDGSFKLNDEPVTYNDGSRMVQGARPGAIKPSGSTAGKCDLTRIGHFLRAFFDQYKCTTGTAVEGVTYYTHEFYGREDQYLTSFHGWATFDIFQKHIKGLLLESLKLEVSDDYMNQNEEWIYMDEESDEIDQAEYDIIEVENDIPLMFYDITIQLDDEDINNPARVYTSFSFEGKNNFNQDGTVGLGSRRPQRQAAAQGREITVSLNSYLDPSSLELIRGAEYGEKTITTPSQCKILKVPLRVIVQACENQNERLEMFFPKCTVNVEYSASESDEIETTFNLTALGTGTAELLDNSTVKTDCYCRLVNTVPEITYEIEEGATEP